MSRRPGLPKTGGRKKGTPNKKTQDLEATLTRLGVDVPTRILEMLPQLEPDKQIDVLMGFMAYLYPKRKAVEQQVQMVSKENEMEELSPGELNRRMARSYEVSAWTTDEPEIAEAYRKLAAYYGSLGDTPPPPA
jgi:hypothetical protein